MTRTFPLSMLSNWSVWCFPALGEGSCLSSLSLEETFPFLVWKLLFLLLSHLMFPPLLPLHEEEQWSDCFHPVFHFNSWFICTKLDWFVWSWKIFLCAQNKKLLLLANPFLIFFNYWSSLVFFKSSWLCFIPLVWSLNWAGPSCWPEPSEEFLVTSHHPRSSLGPSGPLASGLGHCCPPRRSELYIHPGSTWRRRCGSYSKNQRLYSHQSLKNVFGLFVEGLTSSWASCSSVHQCPKQSEMSSCQGPKFPHWIQWSAKFPSPDVYREASSNLNRLWKQLFYILQTLSIWNVYLFRSLTCPVSSLASSVDFPAESKPTRITWTQNQICIRVQIFILHTKICICIVIIITATIIFTLSFMGHLSFLNLHDHIRSSLVQHDTLNNHDQMFTRTYFSFC